jgi:predicted DNA-binding transcriptional regulator AlpA
MRVSRQSFETFLNEYELAEMLNISVATVRRWRFFHVGPQYVKLGASVRYRRADIESWLRDQPTGGTAVEEVK